MSYDSRPEVYEHITRVRELLLLVVGELLQRAHLHDASKLVPPEVEAFDEQTPKLQTVVYGSDEYFAALAAMRPALEHHYAVNRHHPEHFQQGLLGMNLVDLVEMLCDWKAASERTGARASLHGCEMKAAEASPFVDSISTVNASRFGYGWEVERLLENTACWLEEA